MLRTKLIGASPKFKHIAPCLKIIEELQKEQSIIINAPANPLDKLIVKFKKDQNFQILINGQQRHIPFAQNFPLKVTLRNHELELEKQSVSTRTLDGDTLDIYTFNSSGFKKAFQYYYRLMIPITFKIDLEDRLTCTPYKTKNSTNIEFTSVKIDGTVIDIFVNQQKGKRYIIFDSNKKTTQSEFDRYVYSIITTLGFLSGKVVGDEGYFFMYEMAEMDTPVHFSFTELRSSVESQYYPLNISANFLSISPDEKKKYRKDGRVLTSAEFSNLVQRSFDNVDFSSILLLIVEASAASLLLMPAGFSVALEGLTEIIVKDNEETLAPIQDKKLAVKIRKELKEVVERHSGHLSTTGKKILNGKIENINQLTNKSKLTVPFRLLKIPLSENDEAAINHRNDFLHGNTSLGLSNDVRAASSEVLYISLRLYTLLCALILKSVGFDNYILNFPKIYEAGHNKKVDELYFKKL